MNVNWKIVTGLGTALAASLCCITPLLALLSGVSSLASAFSWLEPARPYFTGVTVVLLAWAWYRKLKPGKQVACDCPVPVKTKFIHSKRFLGIVTVLTGLLLAFPAYAHVFYPAAAKPVEITGNTRITTHEFSVSGMTCAACGEHINRQVNQLPGVTRSAVSYPAGKVVVSWDTASLSLTEIINVINATGYPVTDQKKR